MFVDPRFAGAVALAALCALGTVFHLFWARRVPVNRDSPVLIVNTSLIAGCVLGVLVLLFLVLFYPIS